jgi:hypothetical protein
MATIAQSVAKILDDHVSLSVEGIDRMHLDVYVPTLQRDKDVAWFFRGHRGQPFASSAPMAPMSRHFVTKLERYAREHEIEVVQFRSGERKDDVMAERLRRFEHAEGVVFIGKAQDEDRGRAGPSCGLRGRTARAQLGQSLTPTPSQGANNDRWRNQQAYRTANTPFCHRAPGTSG